MGFGTLERGVRRSPSRRPTGCQKESYEAWQSQTGSPCTVHEQLHPSSQNHQSAPHLPCWHSTLHCGRGVADAGLGAAARAPVASRHPTATVYRILRMSFSIRKTVGGTRPAQLAPRSSEASRVAPPMWCQVQRRASVGFAGSASLENEALPERVPSSRGWHLRAAVLPHAPTSSARGQARRVTRRLRRGGIAAERSSTTHRWCTIPMLQRNARCFCGRMRIRAFGPSRKTAAAGVRDELYFRCPAGGSPHRLARANATPPLEPVRARPRLRQPAR